MIRWSENVGIFYSLLLIKSSIERNGGRKIVSATVALLADTGAWFCGAVVLFVNLPNNCVNIFWYLQS